MAKTATAPVRKKAVGDRIELEYRLYRIVAGAVGQTCKAIAYLGMGGLRPIETVEAASVDEAVSRMKEVLEARLAAMRLERRDGIPTAAEFRESIAALPASIREGLRELQIERLDPLLPSPALTTLSMRMRTDVETIAEDLRKAARRLGDLLDPKLQDAAKADPLVLLATVAGTDPEGVPILSFYDEFREALATLQPERTEPPRVCRRLQLPNRMEP